MLSIIINVKNGERYLNQCLAALVRFTEVILLDNHSTDNTIAIAKKYANVKIFTSDFLGMGRLRNLAASFASNDWVFFVDCDEVLTPELVDYLLAVKQFDNNTVYQVRRLNYYANYRLCSSSWDNDWILRLFNRHSTQFTENQVHESIAVNNLKTARIDIGSIYHFPYYQVNGLIDKMQFYSSLYAKQFYLCKRPRLFMIPLRAFFMFLKCYILKRGFLDGYEGFLVSSYNAIGVFSKYIKLYELYYSKNITLMLRVTQPAELANLIRAINAQLRLPNKVLFVVSAENYAEITTMLSGKLVVSYALLSDNESNVIKDYLATTAVVDEHVVLLDNLTLLHQSRLIEDIHKSLVKQVDCMADYKVFKR